MSNLSAPPVPELSSERIAARQQHLVSELAAADRRPARQRWQPSKRLAAGGVGAVGVLGALTAILLVSLVGNTQQAFAGWSAAPTTPASGQLQAAETSCQHNPTLASLAPSVADTRGPFSLLVYAANDTSTVCITGLPFGTGQQGLSPIFFGGAALPASGAVNSPSVAAGAIEPESQIAAASAGGQAYRVVDGQVGADVTAVSLVLDDGSSIEATTSNGWFAAWWPGNQGAKTANITTATASTTQPLNIPTTNVGGENPPVAPSQGST
jgi:hypothetical protein